jgi:hypothetical protein
MHRWKHNADDDDDDDELAKTGEGEMVEINILNWGKPSANLAGIRPGYLTSGNKTFNHCCMSVQHGVWKSPRLDAENPVAGSTMKIHVTTSVSHPNNGSLQWDDKQ